MGGMVDLMDGSFPGPIAPVEFQITDTERGIVKLLVGKYRPRRLAIQRCNSALRRAQENGFLRNEEIRQN
jgi:hypothetical protein